MKKILLSAIIAMTCLPTIYAQQPQRDRRAAVTPEKIVQRMDRALDLTDEQEKELTALYTDFYKDLKEKKQDNTKGSRKERKLQRQEFNQKMNAILTPEQQQKWADIKKAQLEKRKAKAERK